MNLFAVCALAALIPLVIGAVWYNPKIGLGKIWLAASGTSEEPLPAGKMALIFGLTYLFSFFLAFILSALVIHQSGIESLFADVRGNLADPSTPDGALYAQIVEALYGKFRTFKHGALHGTIVALFFAMPLISIIALFERKGFKYIAVHTGYWLICMILMGGVICEFAAVGP